jgi:hypothetical protein
LYGDSAKVIGFGCPEDVRSFKAATCGFAETGLSETYCKLEIEEVTTGFMER